MSGNLKPIADKNVSDADNDAISEVLTVAIDVAGQATNLHPLMLLNYFTMALAFDMRINCAPERAEVVMEAPGEELSPGMAARIAAESNHLNALIQIRVEG